MTASATPVIVGALLFLCLVAAVGLGAAYYLWRWTRRRTRLARMAWRNAERAAMATPAGRVVLDRLHRLGDHRPDGGDQNRTAGRQATADVAAMALPDLRRRLWQAVGDANRAVGDAVAAGAPVGELPSLNRRLRSTAEALDRLLATGDDGRLAGVRRQVADLLSAAGAVRAAAAAAMVAAVSDATEVHLRELVADTDREVHSLAAGIDRYTPHRR